MTIRTLVAAAALAALTTPAFADENVAILDDSVSTGGLFALGSNLFPFAFMAGITAIVIVTQDDAPVTTSTN